MIDFLAALGTIFLGIVVVVVVIWVISIIQGILEYFRGIKKQIESIRSDVGYNDRLLKQILSNMEEKKTK